MTKHIGFIGSGQMAEALIRGILTAKLYTSSQIHATDPNETRRRYLHDTYDITVSDDNETVLRCDYIILAVKPQHMEEALLTIRDNLTPDHLLITIAAGLPLSFYAQKTGRNNLRIIRVMPNTPALLLAGASALAPNGNATSHDMNTALDILNAVGTTVVIEEHQLDAVTGLSGSGPTYVYSFIDGLISAGVEQGLPLAISEKLVLQTVEGALKMVRETGEHPARLTTRVTSPGGTAIAGVHVLKRAGFEGILMDCVAAATKRSKELGNS
ncbi:pyrroline-5-carboxylate reductase [Desulforhopalus vacuolatus]|uniref:pyrroline-5-carboxylate reductase n=1 Tax=Desulforhopalus vacuolatus TaxID=40414 RepID=UPI001965402A|nr:pyrroline-5-carboxylate reductase [Desulforhopalus vacuolatus]MBM9519068.1 pyrroline-5-carboxylate reductase [Desulforhopalus vacuolatus]